MGTLTEWAASGENSSLHVLILDEFDALARRRGGSFDSTGVRDRWANPSNFVVCWVRSFALFTLSIYLSIYLYLYLLLLLLLWQ